MKGHIYSRSKGSYTIVFDLPREADGKRRQKTITIRCTRREAEAKLAEILHQLNGGTYVEPAKMTLGEFLDRWLEDYAKEAVRPSTLKLYWAIVANQLKPRLGHIPLSRLAPLDLQRYYAWALKEGRVNAEGNPVGKPLSPASVRKHHNLIHRALTHAVKWGLANRNVADMVEPPAVERPEIHPLTADQALRLLDASRSTGRYALYLAAVTTGLRRGELLGLRWQDVDLDVGTASVVMAMKRSGLGSTKTRGSVRQIALSPSLVQALREHRAIQDEERKLWGPEWQEHGLVFTGDAGRPISPRNLVRQFKLLLKKAGLPNSVRFHDLRHTHATLLFRKGVHPKAVQERLGHSSITVTMDTYSHILPTIQREAAVTADEALFGTPRETPKNVPKQ
ncbi:MAG: tyrosine-type recombinase/integrase [Bacillota bacterium]|nr:tyrosine-type recombinase/integrase [Bacillota bacterium]